MAECGHPPLGRSCFSGGDPGLRMIDLLNLHNVGTAGAGIGGVWPGSCCGKCVRLLMHIPDRGSAGTGVMHSPRWRRNKEKTRGDYSGLSGWLIGSLAGQTPVLQRCAGDSSDQPAPSYGDLAALVTEQAATIKQLREDNKRLRARVAELEARLGQNPHPSPSAAAPAASPAGRTATRAEPEPRPPTPTVWWDTNRQPVVGAGPTSPMCSGPGWCAVRSWTCPPSPPP